MKQRRGVRARLRVAGRSNAVRSRCEQRENGASAVVSRFAGVPVALAARGSERSRPTVHGERRPAGPRTVLRCRPLDRGWFIQDLVGAVVRPTSTGGRPDQQTYGSWSASWPLAAGVQVADWDFSAGVRAPSLTRQLSSAAPRAVSVAHRRTTLRPAHPSGERFVVESALLGLAGVDCTLTSGRASAGVCRRSGRNSSRPTWAELRGPD
jgi:hypothetical protein